MHILATVVVLIIPVIIWLKLIGLMILLSNCFYEFYYQEWPLYFSGLTALQIQADELNVKFREGQWLPILVTPQTTVTPWFIVLCLEMERAKVNNVVLPYDVMEAEQFRQLRVWLKWSKKS